MRSGSATKINKIYLLSVRLTISKKIILALVCYPHLPKTTERLGHHDGSSRVISRSLKRDRDYSNSLTLTNENRTLPQLNLYDLVSSPLLFFFSSSSFPIFFVISVANKINKIKIKNKFKKRKGLFSCWEKDPSTRKTLEGGSS